MTSRAIELCQFLAERNLIVSNRMSGHGQKYQRHETSDYNAIHFILIFEPQTGALTWIKLTVG